MIIATFSPISSKSNLSAKFSNNANFSHAFEKTSFAPETI